MNCSDFQELISAQLDKELTTQEEQILAQHLKVCSHCVSFKKALEEIKVATSAWKNVQIPIELEKEILKRTVKQTQRKAPLFSFFLGYYKVPRCLAWASTLLFLLLFLHSLLNPLRTIPGSERVEKPTQSITKVQKVVLTEKDVVKTYTVSEKKSNL